MDMRESDLNLYTIINSPNVIDRIKLEGLLIEDLDLINEDLFVLHDYVVGCEVSNKILDSFEEFLANYDFYVDYRRFRFNYDNYRIIDEDNIANRENLRIGCKT